MSSLISVLFGNRFDLSQTLVSLCTDCCTVLIMFLPIARQPCGGNGKGGGGKVLEGLFVGGGKHVC